jgi:hypothetical protein
MLKLFTEHPATVNETYFEHLCTAMTFAATMFVATLVCFVHSLLPFMFVKTGSSLITKLHDTMVTNRVRNASTQDASDGTVPPLEFMI